MLLQIFIETLLQSYNNPFYIIIYGVYKFTIAYEQMQNE